MTKSKFDLYPRESDPMLRTKIAVFAVALLIGLGLTLTPRAEADTGWNKAPAPSLDLCDRGISCSWVYHSRRGVDHRILVNCGKHSNPGKMVKLSKGEDSRDPGNCAKRVNGVKVPAGYDLIQCRKTGIIVKVVNCFPAYTSTGWHYLSNLQHRRLHVVHNDACGQQCTADVR